jgi:hypothetical protein
VPKRVKNCYCLFLPHDYSTFKEIGGKEMNTKQRRRKEQTLMENINKEEEVKTDIKGKGQGFYVDLPTPPGDASNAQRYFRGETRCFLRWEFSRFSDLHFSDRGRILLGGIGRRMALKPPL